MVGVRNKLSRNLKRELGIRYLQGPLKSSDIPGTLQAQAHGCVHAWEAKEKDQSAHLWQALRLHRSRKCRGETHGLHTVPSAKTGRFIGSRPLLPTYRDTQDIKQYYEQLYANQLNNVDEMGQFLETHKLSKLTEEEIKKY